MTPDASEYPDAFVIYPRRSKLVRLLLASITFVVIGIWIGTPGVSRRVATWQVVIASYIGVPFFGFAAVYTAYRLLNHRPVVEVDSTGVTDAASALGAGRLSWDEVDHVVLYKYSGQSMLGIVPRDINGFLSRQHFVRRALIKLNLSLGCAPVNIPQVALPIKVADFAGLLHTRYGVRVEGDA